MPSEQHTTRELPERILRILEQARIHFQSDKAQRKDLRSWYEETFGYKWVPPEIIKNGYLQVPGERGWYWLAPQFMNKTPLTESRSDDETIDLEESAGVDGVPGTEFEGIEAGFALERQLRDFIAHNLSKIPVAGKRLRLYVDPDGRNGIEYPSAVGPIDILAVDDHDSFFVFELKRSRSPDQTIGQLSRYMGWVKQAIAVGTREVHGVIVAREIADNLRYGASVFPNVSLFEYEIDFRLKPAHELRKNANGG